MVRIGPGGRGQGGVREPDGCTCYNNAPICQQKSYSCMPRFSSAAAPLPPAHPHIEPRTNLQPHGPLLPLLQQPLHGRAAAPGCSLNDAELVQVQVLQVLRVTHGKRGWHLELAHTWARGGGVRAGS